LSVGISPNIELVVLPAGMALRLAWADRTPLLQRSAPAAQATWRVFTALRGPTAALHTRAPTNPKQINSLISK